MRQRNGSGVRLRREGDTNAMFGAALSSSRKLAFSIADQALSVGGMLLANVFLARICSKEEYGLFVLAYSVFTFLASLHNAVVLEPFTVYGSGKFRASFRWYRHVMLRTNAMLGLGFSLV